MQQIIYNKCTWFGYAIDWKCFYFIYLCFSVVTGIRATSTRRNITSDTSTSLDLRRLRNMTITGLIGGFLGHYWYLFLDSRSFTGKTLTVVLKKTLIDQIVLCPVGITMFFFILGYLDGNTNEEITQEMKEKAPGLLIFDWIIYPPAQFVNFMFLPTRFRVMYESFVAFIVDLYYCHTKFERW